MRRGAHLTQCLCRKPSHVRVCILQQLCQGRRADITHTTKNMHGSHPNCGIGMPRRFRNRGSAISSKMLQAFRSSRTSAVVVRVPDEIGKGKSATSTKKLQNLASRSCHGLVGIAQASCHSIRILASSCALLCQPLKCMQTKRAGLSCANASDQLRSAICLELR